MSWGSQSSVRSKAVWDAVHTSFWFVPSLMMLAAPCLALAATWLDHALLDEIFPAPWWLYSGTPAAARDLLLTLLSSSITMTSLVFSITIVVLTLAASQFGPRLVRNFMASGATQIVFGTFVMTILYCLMALAGLGRNTSGASFAFLAVTLAIVLVAVSVVLLVPFMHSLARSIVSETIIERVGMELDQILDGFEPLGPEEPPEPVGPFMDHARMQGTRFGPQKAGYIQSIEFEQLVELGARAGIVIELDHHPGKFVVPNGHWITVRPGHKLTPQIRASILKTITTGVNRTPVQDVDFPIRHLVEIAVRALSPSLNDPYTAIAVLHRLSVSMSRLMGLSLPSRALRDKTGEIRVLCSQPNHKTVLAACFDQIRQHGAGHPIVVIHHIEALKDVAEHCRHRTQRGAVQRQLEWLGEDAAREVPNAADRKAIAERLEVALETIRAQAAHSESQ